MNKTNHRRGHAASGETGTAHKATSADTGRRGDVNEPTVTVAVPETLNSATKVVALRRGLKFAKTLVAALLRADPDVRAAEQEILASRGERRSA